MESNKQIPDEYHNDLMNDWLKYMSCWSSSKSKPTEPIKETTNHKDNSPKHKEIPTPQYFYDISTNLFIPSSN